MGKVKGIGRISGVMGEGGRRSGKERGERMRRACENGFSRLTVVGTRWLSASWQCGCVISFYIRERCK